MAIKLRPYQQESVDAVLSYIRSNSEPCIISLPTGSGKSIVVAMLAQNIFNMSGGKRVLCLAPSKELIEQNYEKYTLLGEKASIYSASVGQKSLRHQVIFATEGTFKKIAKSIGHEFAGVVIDEAHKTTDTIKTIIAEMKEGNPNLRVIGMSATPYRLGDGYVYEMDLNNRIVEEANDPFFKKLVYRITARELIAMGYLTPPTLIPTDMHYDTSGLKLTASNTFSHTSLDKAFTGQGKLTSNIIADVVARSHDRQGVMIFAATIRHAEEIMDSLPNQLSAMVTGSTPKAEREDIIQRFKDQKIKYLVNVAVLTTGFDAPHVNHIVIMRATESAALYQQIIGRGTRLCEGKNDFLVSDYTDNINELFPSGDIFEPSIKAYGRKENPKIEVTCPTCSTVQEFSKRPNFDDYNEYGYAVDLAGDVLEPLIPAHYGRRCTNVVLKGLNRFVRCDYFWANKECEECGHHNDIAARICESCKHQLIDPNDKLNDVAVVLYGEKKIKVEVTAMHVDKGKTKSGGDVINVTFETEDNFIPVRFYPNHHNNWIARQASVFRRVTHDGAVTPKHVEYTKEKKGYYQIDRYFM